MSGHKSSTYCRVVGAKQLEKEQYQEGEAASEKQQATFRHVNLQSILISDLHSKGIYHSIIDSTQTLSGSKICIEPIRIQTCPAAGNRSVSPLLLLAQEHKSKTVTHAHLATSCYARYPPGRRPNMTDVRRRHPTRRTRSTIFLPAMFHYVTCSYAILTAKRSQAAADLHEKVNKRNRCAIEGPVNMESTTHDINTHVQVCRHGPLSSARQSVWWLVASTLHACPQAFALLPLPSQFKHIDDIHMHA